MLRANPRAAELRAELGWSRREAEPGPGPGERWTSTPVTLSVRGPVGPAKRAKAVRTAIRTKGLLRRSRKMRPQEGVARVDARTKNLVPRALPGDIAVIDHEDLDRVAAEGLVASGVAAVVNAASSISGRYPNLGPLVLLGAGIPLIDHVGPLVMEKVREGDLLRLDGDRVFAGERLVGVGVRQSEQSVRAAMAEAQLSLADRFDSFARNTVDFIKRERDLLFGGAGLPSLDHDFTGRPVLVVVRGYNYKEDLAVLRPFIRDVRPVLVGVDGGADALIEAGYLPDLIMGDMDSVSDDALRNAIPGRRRFRRRPPTEVIVHAYEGGDAPGRNRVESLGVPFKVVEATGTSEDVAFLMAHEKGAELIVAVGSHGNLREFLDKGRMGMASTFLVRLRVGEILMDAKGVSRVYTPRVRAGDSVLIVGAAVLAMALVVALASPALRLWAIQVFEQFRQWLFRLKELL